MRTSPVLIMLNNIRVKAVIIISLLLPMTAAATVIDFDELDPVYQEEPCWCDNPLSDEYIDKGLIIHEAWVIGKKPNNSMLTSNWAKLEFVGEPPTFLSMNVSSAYGDAIYLEFYGEHGYLDTIITSGWRNIEEDYTPPIPNEFISFTSGVGIKSVVIYGHYNMRLGADIDNITFTSTAVPEPSSIALIFLGIFMILLRRFRRQPCHPSSSLKGSQTNYSALKSTSKITLQMDKF